MDDVNVVFWNLTFGVINT